MSSPIVILEFRLGIGAEVVRDALHMHRTGKRPPGRGDGRRRRPRQPNQPFVPKYQQIAPEVDRRREAGEGFDRLAREMKISRGTVLRAYDFANRDEATAAAREAVAKRAKRGRSSFLSPSFLPPTPLATHKRQGSSCPATEPSAAFETPRGSRSPRSGHRRVPE